MRPAQRGFYRYDSPPAPEEIDDMLNSGQITPSKAAVLWASHYNSLGQTDEVERVLREALFTTPDEHQRAHVLRLLARHLCKQNRDVELQKSNREHSSPSIRPLAPSSRGPSEGQLAR